MENNLDLIFNNFSDPDAFCTKQNLDGCVKYLSSELAMLGYSEFYEESFGASLPYNISRLLYVLNCLLIDRNRLFESKNELKVENTRANVDLEHAQAAERRLKERLEKTNRSVTSLQESIRQLNVKVKHALSLFRLEKDENRKLEGILSQKQDHYHHEVRRLEKETNLLKEKVRQSFSHRNAEKKLGFTLINPLQRSDGKRTKWQCLQTCAQSHKNLCKVVSDSYDSERKKISKENELLKKTIKYFFREFPKFIHENNPGKGAFKTPSYIVNCNQADNSSTPILLNPQDYLELPFEVVHDRVQEDLKRYWNRIKQMLTGRSYPIRKKVEMSSDEEELNILREQFDDIDEILMKKGKFNSASTTDKQNLIPSPFFDISNNDLTPSFQDIINGALSVEKLKDIEVIPEKELLGDGNPTILSKEGGEDIPTEEGLNTFKITISPKEIIHGLPEEVKLKNWNLTKSKEYIEDIPEEGFLSDRKSKESFKVHYEGDNKDISVTKCPDDCKTKPLPVLVSSKDIPKKEQLDNCNLLSKEDIKNIFGDESVSDQKPIKSTIDQLEDNIKAISAEKWLEDHEIELSPKENSKAISAEECLEDRRPKSSKENMKAFSKGVPLDVLTSSKEQYNKGNEVFLVEGLLYDGKTNISAKHGSKDDQLDYQKSPEDHSLFKSKTATELEQSATMDDGNRSDKSETSQPFDNSSEVPKTRIIILETGKTGLYECLSQSINKSLFVNNPQALTFFEGKMMFISDSTSCKEVLQIISQDGEQINASLLTDGTQNATKQSTITGGTRLVVKDQV